MSKTGTAKQLPLGMWLRQGASFKTYLGAANQQLLQGLQNNAEQFIFFWGGEGLGKSHLLQAACHAATAAGETSVYLPMREAAQFAPEMLEGLEGMALVAIDDVDAIAAGSVWETALFDLYNRIRDSGQTRLLVTASRPLSALKLLPDLQSRLGWGLVYQVQAMNDAEKLLALKQRADMRGFELPEEVAQYLARHYPRQSSALFALLDRLDQYSLAEQRRLTIPFVKQIIEDR